MAILVVDAPHDLLHDIAHRNDARRAAVLVNDHGDLGMTALQQLQKFRDGDALGHRVQLSNGQVLHRSVGVHHEQVFHMNEPDQMILAPLTHRIARVLVAFGKLTVLLK